VKERVCVCGRVAAEDRGALDDKSRCVCVRVCECERDCLCVRERKCACWWQSRCRRSKRLTIRAGVCEGERE